MFIVMIYIEVTTLLLGLYDDKYEEEKDEN